MAGIATILEEMMVKIDSINPDDWIGELTDEKCSRCGERLYNNKKDEEWCSNPECTYGMEDTHDALGLY